MKYLAAKLFSVSFDRPQRDKLRRRKAKPEKDSKSTSTKALEPTATSKTPLPSITPQRVGESQASRARHLLQYTANQETDLTPLTSSAAEPALPGVHTFLPPPPPPPPPPLLPLLLRLVRPHSSITPPIRRRRRTNGSQSVRGMDPPIIGLMELLIAIICRRLLTLLRPSSTDLLNQKEATTRLLQPMTDIIITVLLRLLHNYFLGR